MCLPVSSCVDRKSYLCSVACTWKLFGNFGFIEFEYKWVPVFSLPTKITKWWTETSETTTSINWKPCSENQSWYGIHTVDKIVFQRIRSYFNLVKFANLFDYNFLCSGHICSKTSSRLYGSRQSGYFFAFFTNRWTFARTFWTKIWISWRVFDWTIGQWTFSI